MARSFDFGTFVAWVPTLFPSWLRKKWGLRFAQTMGLTLDGIGQGVRDAIYARFIKLSPTDALQWIGEERGLFRFPVPVVELAEKWRARLLSAWDQWALSGAPQGIVAGLAAPGYTAVVHESRKDVDTRPNTWDRPDHDVSRWAWFWVELPASGHDLGSTCWHVGDGTLVGPDTCIGFGKPYSWVNPRLTLIRRIIHKWKQAEMKCGSIVVGLSGLIVGSFTVGGGVTIGGVVAYPPLDP
jgi:hypothetical protein